MGMLEMALERAALPSQTPVAETPELGFHLDHEEAAPQAEPERPEPARDASGRFTSRPTVSVRGGKVRG